MTRFIEVPTSNSISYSNSSGEINNMIAPVRIMVGDTMRLRYSYINGMDSIMIVLEWKTWLLRTENFMDNYIIKHLLKKNKNLIRSEAEKKGMFSI